MNLKQRLVRVEEAAKAARAARLREAMLLLGACGVAASSALDAALDQVVASSTFKERVVALKAIMTLLGLAEHDPALLASLERKVREVQLMTDDELLRLIAQ